MAMSFSIDCKRELSQTPTKKPCCALSELCAFYQSLGKLSLLGHRKVNVQFECSSFRIARYIYGLLKSSLGIVAQLHYVTSPRFGGIRKCVLTLGTLNSPMFLSSLGMMKKNPQGLYDFVHTSAHLPLTRNCCMRAYLRGMLLGAGQLINPEKGYHLELSYQDEQTRAMVSKCLQKLQLPIKQSARRQQPYLYIKKCDDVVTFLTAVGAHQAVITLENMRVKRQVMANLVRAANCDTANFKKLIHSSETQTAAILQMEKDGILETLPASLQAIATLRKQAPAATLEELGELCTPPISKSAVNHRMRRLLDYQTIREEDPQHENHD